MTSNEWARIDDALETAADLTDAERVAFLDRLGADSPEVRSEVESLLAGEERSAGFLAPSAITLSADFFGKAETDSFIGQTIGSYRVSGELGRGGMGAVYLAERVDGRFEQKVAVKLLKRELNTADIRRRFRQERQILARLSHPNISRLVDAGTTNDGLPFLVMEYVRGLPIDEYCETQDLDLKRRLEIFRTVCDAVGFAHRNLIVHRDLKPSNILVDADGSAKLLDFGISKLLDPDLKSESKHTVTRLGAMTPEYASPEQLRGESVTTATDVYSLGVLFAKLIKAEPSASTGRVTLANRRSNSNDSPTKPQRTKTKHLRPGTELEAILAMARREEPERRYASVQQFGEDVQRYLDGLPVQAQKDSLRYRAGKFARRNKIPVFAGFLIAVSLVSGIAIALWQADAARRQRDVANAERLRATRINEFLQQMLSFSNQSVASVSPVPQTRNVTVNQMLDEIAPRVEAELTEQPEVRAQILRTIGSAYASQGIYDKAEKNYRSALETQTRIFGTDHPETAATMTELSVLSFRQGKIAEANQLSESAVAFYKRQRANQDPEFLTANLVLAMDFLGAAKYFAGDVESSVSTLQEAVQIGESAGFQGHERFVLAHALGDLGFVLARTGEIDRADRILRESLALFRQVSEHPPWEMGATLATLGELYNRQNQPDQALEFLMESERIYRQTLGDKNRYLGFNLQHQAVALSLQKNFTHAEPKAREALAIYHEVVPGNKLAAALPSSALGIVLVGNGRYDEAEKYLFEGLQGSEQSPFKNHFINVHAKIALSQCLLHKNRPAEAEELALAAHDLARQLLDEQHLLVKTAAESLNEIYRRQGKSR